MQLQQEASTTLKHKQLYLSSIVFSYYFNLTKLKIEHHYLVGNTDWFIFSLFLVGQQKEWPLLGERENGQSCCSFAGYITIYNMLCLGCYNNII